MTAFAHFLDRIANGKSLVFLLLLYVSFPAYWLKNAETTINQLAGKPVGIIDLTMGFNPARTLRMVADYGPAARVYYAQTELTVDVVYPLLYGFLLAIILTLLFRHRAYKPFEWVTLVPFAGTLFDYLENAAIVGLLTSYPAQSPALAVVGEMAKLAKWVLFGASVLLIVYGLYRLILTKLRASPY